MRPQDVLNYSQAQPFRPFRIQTTGGRTFEIRHPEMVRVGRSARLVFSFVSEDPAVFDRYGTVSLLLVERPEHLDIPTAA